MSFRSRNRGRKLLQTPLLKACRLFFIATALLFMIAYEVRPGGRLRGLHLASIFGRNDKDAALSQQPREHITPPRSWRKAFRSSVKAAVASSKCRQAVAPQTRRPAATAQNAPRASAAATPPVAPVLCAVVPRLFRLDPAAPLVASRTAHVLWAHLRAAAAFHALEWCPSFSASGWEVGRHVSYFRGVPRSMAAGGTAAGTAAIDVYCHTTTPASVLLPNGGKTPTIDPLSPGWWETMQCYASPVERWMAAWSNCTGVLNVPNLPPPSPAALHHNPTATAANGAPCAKTCRLVAPASGPLYPSTTTALRNGNDARQRRALRAQQQELERIRRQVSAAAAHGVREKECGYEKDTWDVAFHVRESAGLKFVVGMMRRLEAAAAASAGRAVDKLRFHVHLDMPTTSANAATPSFVSDHIAMRAASGIVLGSLKHSAPGSPSRAIRIVSVMPALAQQKGMSWGPVRRLECLRVADALVLTRGSLAAFAAVPAVLGRARPVALPQADLDVALSMVSRIKKELPTKVGAGRRVSLALMAMALASGGDTERARWRGFDDGLAKSAGGPVAGFLLQGAEPGGVAAATAAEVGVASIPKPCAHAPVVPLVGSGRVFGGVPRTGMGAPLRNLDAGALVAWGRKMELLGRQALREGDEAVLFGAPEVCGF